MGSIPQTSLPRRLPVRADAEPLRSRRFSSEAFEAWFLVEARVGERWLCGRVLDVSVHGVSLLVSSESLAQGPDDASSTAWEFEVGQALSSVRLSFYGQELYRGEAEVRHCSADAEGIRVGLALTSDFVDLVALHRTSARLAFRRDWQTVIGQAPPAAPKDFADWLRQAREKLTAIRTFLGQAELASRAEDLLTRAQTLDDMLAEASIDVLALLRQFRDQLNHWVDHFSEEQHQVHRQLLREQLGELLDECPFIWRALHRPLGYAGDYELMNMIYRGETEGDSLFGRVLNRFSTSEPGSRATYNRLDYLGRILDETLHGSLRPRVRVASIGCGAARELQVYLDRAPDQGGRLELALLDQDERAIAHCERALTPLARNGGARFQFICEPIQALIGSEHMSSCLGQRELIYSAGLFDYLDDELFVDLVGALYGCLTPGGRLVVGNMGAHNPSRHLMEYVMDWQLIYRTRAELLALGRQVASAPEAVWVDAEPEGLNLFLHILR